MQVEVVGSLVCQITSSQHWMATVFIVSSVRELSGSEPTQVGDQLRHLVGRLNRLAVQFKVALRHRSTSSRMVQRSTPQGNDVLTDQVSTWRARDRRTRRNRFDVGFMQQT